MQINIKISDLKKYQIKANRKAKSSTRNKANTVSIYKTTQGKNKNDGINIDFRNSEFLNYANINIFLVYGKLLFELSSNYSDDSFRLSINRSTSDVSTVKISKQSDVDALKPLIGEWNLELVPDEESVVYTIH